MFLYGLLYFLVIVFLFSGSLFFLAGFRAYRVRRSKNVKRDVDGGNA